MNVNILPWRLSWRLLFAVLVAGGVMYVDAALRPSVPPHAQAVSPVNAEQVRTDRLQRVAQGHIPMPADTLAAHASTLLPMPAGNAAVLTMFWFSASAKVVRMYKLPHLSLTERRSSGLRRDLW